MSEPRKGHSKPTLEALASACPGVDESLLRNHLERLDERYFARFNSPVIATHVQALSRLSPEHPVEILLDFLPQQKLECTVLAFDYVGEFSLITGILSGLGVNILSGGIHTYARVEEPPPPPRGRSPQRRKVASDPWLRRRIVDHFSGTLETDLPLDRWGSDLRRHLQEALGLLERGQEADRSEAKHRVNELVARRLERLQGQQAPVLYPMQISMENDRGPFTRLRVVSQDTPAFLYALSNALSVKGISIEHVRISTDQDRIEDLIDFVDSRGEQITDSVTLDQVRLSVLLTKQFTHFLGQAPDPFAALSRFEKLVADLLALPEQGHWLELLSSPRLLRDLAQLLGTSDFLWEDMIRLQYETLLPMLAPHMEGRRFADALETLPERLEQALADATDLDTQTQRLNEFKDREIYLIDLDHILTPGADFRHLSEYLTFLATVVARAAVRLNYEALAARHGRPRTVAGLEATFAILGLGKFGGAALGYASDIELQFVYSDHGQTDGAEPIANSEFFERLVLASTKSIRAKREGIFNIDLRLRPYGQDGPLATSLETFCNYYGPHGPAHALERLALVRLRALGGDRELGERLERVRDQFLYESHGYINLEALREMRELQLAEKTQAGRINAKFSPGALVDLEYDVQILQVIYGREHPELRTPRLHQALNGLQQAGVLAAREHEELTAAYQFLRQLINGLRMLRGSAEDLFLPPAGSDEYRHLARRLGYIQQADLDPGQQLRLEFEARTAAVRAFVDRHFGPGALPGREAATVADLILLAEAPPEMQQRILSAAGFQDPARAYVNLRKLAGTDEQRREQFLRLAILACDFLQRQPDPDMALNNWEHFAGRLPDPAAHFEQLRFQPKRLELLLSIFASSQFLADSLARNPEFLDVAVDPKRLQSVRTVEEHRQELGAARRPDESQADWLNRLRRYRRREILRIGTRDIGLHAPLEQVALDLSRLAEALTQEVLEQAWESLRRSGQPDLAADFCILALGKLGGEELNYSSDIDLLGVCTEAGAEARRRAVVERGADPFALALEGVRAALKQYTEEGYAYRVDFRLRPYGVSGELVVAADALLRYYARSASLSEIQALLKLRPVAGNLEFGARFCGQVGELLLAPRAAGEVKQSVADMRRLAVEQLGQHAEGMIDVKSGLGGLRDIEFLVQGLQLIHAHQSPHVLDVNTLRALVKLEQAGRLESKTAGQLREDYIFLRRVEHYLQILEDQQIHTLPVDSREVAALAKRMLGPQGKAEAFLQELSQCSQRVREYYQSFLST
ncbi:MAG: glutamate-ammonia-ligase adenylyltransferase [candidate division FCPU426 bacterium]